MKGKILVTMCLAFALAGAPALANASLNEVGALLVYPVVIALDDDDPVTFESYVTVTNAGAEPVNVHFSYISGDPNNNECGECDFSIPLTGNDTEMLIFRWDGFNTVIETEPDAGPTRGGPLPDHPMPGPNQTPIAFSCGFQMGFLVAALEEPGQGGPGDPPVLTDNVLHGSQVVVNYTRGWAFSIPAISFQGIIGDGNRNYEFNDAEYTKLPRYVAADFIAPDRDDQPSNINASLALFTPGFVRGLVPNTRCSVTGYDAAEYPFSTQLEFGCWTFMDLEDINPEFTYPNLGLTAGAEHTHGWLQLSCQNNFTADGAVHGAIVQRMNGPSVIRRNSLGNAPVLNQPAAWARVLYQSVTTGSPVTLELE